MAGAQIYWRSLDTVLTVVDSATGITFANTVGIGRLQARIDSLRSDPQSIVVLLRLDSASATGSIRDTVTVSAPDSLSDSLTVKVWSGTGGAPGRSVVYAAGIYPAGATIVTFVPREIVQTDAGGIAVARLRLVEGPIPDSVVITAAVRRPNGTHVLGSPVTFVVEFRP